MGELILKFDSIKAILFDMHQTITMVNEGFLSLTRKVAKDVGIDLSMFTNNDINQAFMKFDDWFKRYQIENDVNIRFGSEVEHWTEANRIMFRAIGIDSLSDDVLISVERSWKEHLKTWETLNPDARSTLYELSKRGYPIGICTRRPDDPTSHLRDWGILKILSTVQWSSVPGYAKPYPYTLILAADEMRVNPLRCAYVGDSVEADITAAQRAGMLPILTTWAKPDEREKAPEGISVIDELSELLVFFPGH